MRFDLRVQQVQARHRQFLLDLGLFGGGLLVAALVGNPPADRAGNRFGIFVVAALIQCQQVGPPTGIGLEQQGDGAGALARGDRGQHAVALDRQPRRQVPARRLAAVPQIDAAHIGAHLQAACRAFHLFHPRQFAHGRLDHRERMAGIHRQFDLPALAPRQGGAIEAAGHQPDPPHMGHRTAQRGDHQEHHQQPEHPTGAVVHAAEDAAPAHAGHEQCRGPGEQVTKDEGEAGEHGGALEEGGEPSIGRPAGQTSGLRRRA
ncbi:hypothetical protein G6F35_012717 [Rhizopus arrhizus]|nr:hypothetical protein G6F35_012717 [Rhizopus arrhizus]